MMKLNTFNSKCVSQASIHFKNGWVIQSTIQHKDVDQCICNRNCHLTALVHSIPGVMMVIIPYRWMSPGIYKYEDYKILPIIHNFEIRSVFGIKLPALTIGVSGPKAKNDHNKTYHHTRFYEREVAFCSGKN